MPGEESITAVRRPCQAVPAAAYAIGRHDRVRETLESEFFAALMARLIALAGGGRLLDLGCGDGLLARLARPGSIEYTGVDFRSFDGPFPGRLVAHDLREGLGPVGGAPYDVYMGTFGVASHLAPGELRRLLADIAGHARQGSVVAIEALGLHSLEWPRLWDSAPGRERTLSYRLRADVCVHPWSPRELAGLYEEAGIRPVAALDRSVQAGPKTARSEYWPGLPPLRDALNALMGTEQAEPAQPPLALRDAVDALRDRLPPLPAGFAARAHHSLALRRGAVLAQRGAGALARREEVRARRDAPRAPRDADPFGASTARAVWGLEPRSGRGLGHGLTVVGRVA